MFNVLGSLRLPSIVSDYEQYRLALYLTWVGIFPLLETNAIKIRTYEEFPTRALRPPTIILHVLIRRTLKCFVRCTRLCLCVPLFSIGYQAIVLMENKVFYHVRFALPLLHVPNRSHTREL